MEERVPVIINLRRRVRIMLATCGVLTLGSIFVANPAFADSSITWYKVFPVDRYAHASFQSYGEIFKVSDDEADGYSVRVYWTYSNSQTVQGWCINTSGNGTTKTCDFSIAEGRHIIWCLERYSYTTRALITGSCESDVA